MTSRVECRIDSDQMAKGEVAATAHSAVVSGCGDNAFASIAAKNRNCTGRLRSAKMVPDVTLN